MKLLEKHIEATVTAWLKLDGWRSLRTDPVSDRSRGKGFGEPGMADHLYIRYLDLKTRGGSAHLESLAQVLWIEFKRQKGGAGKKALFTKPEKAKIHQRGWIAAERARGALVLLVGEDCAASIGGILTWYQNSGLMRRKMSIPK